ncbi:BON domain-containing protein [Cupriavidus sp. D384]|uniref:BON domain-containing protein n=1 Tax=Cupriavidus sp. D384 TaxID=1538095 RepID=UPI000AF484DA|nr:BON domain-containing protein [Cupriavidus sp. D384]
MGDYHSERNRRNTPWRADDRRDDDLGDPWDDERGSRWQDQDWQPESSGDNWDDARRRQRLTPGQLSEGGPAPSGYRGRDDQGSDLRYGLNGGYGTSPDDDQDWRQREQYSSRQYASEYGDYGDLGDEHRRTDYGVQRRQGEFGQYGSGGDDRRFSDRGDRDDRGGSDDFGRRDDWRRSRQGGGNRGAGERRDEHGFGNADQAWLRAAERRAPAYRGQGGGQGRGRGGAHTAYFNDLRSDTRYWTEPRDEWGESRPPYHAQRYGRDYMGSSAGSSGYDEELGYSSSRRESGGRWRDEWHEHDENREEDHGALYHLGHRIGQAMSDWFGPGAVEKRTGPRGYTRTDERIRDEICERLTFTTGIDVREVSVEVDKGKVTLGGTVHTRGQKYDIEDLADNTFGVTEVENNIRVQRQEVDSAVTGAGGFNGW